MILPRLYPVIDFAAFAAHADRLDSVRRFAEVLLQGGATLIQYRDKSGDAARMLSLARELRRVTRDRASLIINDRADICLAAQADGVHLGQHDLSPGAARKILSEEGNKRSRPLIVGFSTHNLEQVSEADAMPIDYIAVGPVFATVSKANPNPVIGLEGVRKAKAATQKPLVAIGGITRKNCLQARDAGADAVAVIADLLESPVKALEEFI